jgi:hypothetical protein
MPGRDERIMGASGKRWSDNPQAGWRPRVVIWHSHKIEGVLCSTIRFEIHTFIRMYLAESCCAGSRLRVAPSY